MYPDKFYGPGAEDIMRALGFAACAHRKQKRKYTNEPYINHCVEVAEILCGKAGKEVVMAGLLHDTLEDTDVTLEELADAFGMRVACLVLEVTDVSKPEDGKREIRKSLDRMHLAKSSAEGATIKLADILSNTKTIVQYDKRFASLYIPEKLAALEVLKHGNRYLWDVAYHQLKAAESALAENAA